jgi:lysophospholipase
MTLIPTPGNPIPDGAIAGKIGTPDGIELRFARWDSPGRNRGTVCVFNGRTEFIEKYFETVNELRRRGFAVATMDWRGQGHSSRQLPDPRKGHVKSLAEFEIDVDAFMHQVVLPHCPQPHFVLAHSMGGAALLRVAHSGKQKFERYVLGSPMIDLAGLGGTLVARLVTRAMRLAGRNEQYMLGGSVDRVSSFENNPLTSDRGRFERNAAIVAADPTLGIGSPTVAWLNAAYDTILAFRAADYAAQITQPVLIVGAGDDSVVSTEAGKQFAERLPKGSHRTIAGARHEILQEQDPQRAQFWDGFDRFLPAGTS